MLNLFITLSLSLLLVSNVDAQVYKWVDQDGNIQYTGQPPQADLTGNKEQLKIKTPPPAHAVKDTAISSELTLDEKMQAFKERRESKQEAEKIQQTAAIENNRRCVNAQGQLKIFRESPRLTFPDGNGGIVYADDKMRQKKISDAQKNIDAYCQ